MAIYGRGQMLGSGINPESFKQDYSGFANAAAMQAQGIANLGQSIGGAIQDYGKFKKQQQQDERDVQKSKSLAKAIGDLVPDLKPALKSSLELIDNKEIPLSQRKAEADAISDILTLGIGAITNKQKLDLERSQIEAATNEANARAANKPMTLAEIAMGGGKQQVMLDPVTGIAKPITMQGFEGQPQQTSPLSNLPQPLQRYAKTFEEAGARHGVPPALLAAISMQETGGGTSSAFRNKNNAMGISGRYGPITMPSVEASIEHMANLLGQGINKGTGPYAKAKTIEDIGRVYAPAGAENDPRNLNPGWSQGVTFQLQKLMQAQQPAASPAQGRVGFIPDKPDEQGQILTNQEVTELMQQGFKIKGRPTGDGRTFVTAIESLAPQKGEEIIFNADGTVTKRDISLDRKEKELEKTKRASEFEETRQTNFIIDKANEAEKIIDYSISTYGPGTLLDIAKSTVPGTQEYKLKNQILPAIKDSIALSSLRQLKAASPTGASGLGSLTEKEGKRLENMYGVLDVGGDKATLKNDIKRLKQTVFDYIHGSKIEREKALANGDITKDQNDQVEQMYREQILGITAPTAPTNNAPETGVGLTPEANANLDALGIPRQSTN